MLLGEATENGLYWSLIGKGDFVDILVKDVTDENRMLEYRYECSYAPMFGYDVSDVDQINRKLDSMIDELKLQ